ncbi:hypothetical protein LNV09_09595 [Paucibacter sp. B2R-40]|uniref:hypothetical protein n=1 Tax=Paucibacter sp. B2R-40 TaxID=2893554 RepID=UPI0021E4CE2F|nr:hypothetical protein [Paucibacter sp. B2R-40]MCV2354417.1 hypothetical protein [Paucibacter sp. B2R-40]
MNHSNFVATGPAASVPRIPSCRANYAYAAAAQKAWRILVLESDEAARRSLVTAMQGQVFAGRELQLLLAESPKALMEALDADQDFVAVILNAEYQSSLVGQALVEYIRDIHEMRDCAILLMGAAPFLSCNRTRIESEFLRRYEVSDLRVVCRSLGLEARSDLLQASIEASLSKRCA